VFGGMGFCKELPIERYYRDARIHRIFDGTSEIHRTIIARSVLKRGAALFDLNRDASDTDRSFCLFIAARNIVY
jgi:acyl-CoA dehydrogenase